MGVSVSHEAARQVIELIGPAGAGKTGLLRAIAQLAPTVRTGVRLDRMRTMPVVAWHALALTPATLDLLFTDARWVWPGLRHLCRLRAFPSELEHARGSGHETILLDEGPVFSLGRLSVFQRANEGSGWLARAWNAEVGRWREILTGVVLLDADNTVLAQRIRGPAARDNQGVKLSATHFTERLIGYDRVAFLACVRGTRFRGHRHGPSAILAETQQRVPDLKFLVLIRNQDRNFLSLEFHG